MIDYQTTQVYDANAQGLYIAAVSYNDDFRIGDRLIGVNGAEVNTCGQVRDIISACQVGDVVNVTVMRDDEQVEICVPLTEADTGENPDKQVA